MIHFINGASLGGLIFLLVSWIARRFPPKWPNIWYGYRTPFSLKTKDTFDEGNRYSFALLRRQALGLLAFGCISPFFLHWYDLEYISLLPTALVIICVFYALVKTELHLRKNFHPDGSRKSSMEMDS